MDKITFDTMYNTLKKPFLADDNVKNVSILNNKEANYNAQNDSSMLKVAETTAGDNYSAILVKESTPDSRMRVQSLSLEQTTECQFK